MTQQEPMVLKFDTIVKTGDGLYELTIAMNQEQLQYFVEVGFRTLLTMGAISLPPVTHIPSTEEAETLHKSATEDWKSKLN